MRKNRTFHHVDVGENVLYQSRKILVYGQLIFVDDNILSVSNVSFLTHDAYYAVCNKAFHGQHVNEKVGCIWIGNNCFTTANVLIYNVLIGDDVVIASGDVITKGVPFNEIWGGIPGHSIGYTKELREKYKGNIRINVVKESLSEKSVNEL